MRDLVHVVWFNHTRLPLQDISPHASRPKLSFIRANSEKLRRIGKCGDVYDGIINMVLGFDDCYDFVEYVFSEMERLLQAPYVDDF